MVRNTILVFVFLFLVTPIAAQAETDAQEITPSATQSNNEFMQLRNAAELGDANAMYGLGEKYYWGEGVAEDTNEAAMWYGKAIALYAKDAETGDSEAMYKLGKMYDLGMGVTEDANTALEWYRKASWAGNSEAMYELATYFIMV